MLLVGAPTITLGLTHNLGCTIREIFLKRMQHFKEYANPSEDKNVLLVVDEHSSHKHTDVLTYTKNHGKMIISSSSLHASSKATRCVILWAFKDI